ncbi:hypothetical protein BKA69DRAFT_1043524 [Paraphysoderma sedebokerense]|nr:hypothetical protein BKA69DRAFT_1043524 [Paraphysoderma sedebokerense]
MTAPRYNVTETEARLFLQQMPISILPTPPIQTSQPLFPQNQLPHSSSPLQPYSQNYVQSPTPQIQAPFMHQQNLQRKASITELDEPYMYLYHHEKMEMDELAERTLARFSYKIEAKDGQEEHVCPLCAKRFGMKHNLRVSFPLSKNVMQHIVTENFLYPTESHNHSLPPKAFPLWNL